MISSSVDRDIKMRYIINKDLKKLILANQKELSNNLRISSNIKNLIYKNKTISEKHLNEICKNCNSINVKLKKSNFNPQKNLGKYSQSAKIQFSGRNKKFAEFVGILLGDGNLYNNSIRVTLHKNERSYLNFVKYLIFDLFKINPREYLHQKSNTITLYLYNKNLSTLLLNEGLQKGNKVINQIKIPGWIKENQKYSLMCLRGLIDTDGCVYYCKRDKKKYIKFTNRSENLIGDFLEIAQKNGLNFRSAGKNNICLYRTEEITKYLKKVGFSNDKHKIKMGL